MSADFATLTIAIPRRAAARLLDFALDREVLGAIVGPGEETLARVVPDEPLDVAMIARECAGRAPPPRALENAFVRATLDIVLPMTETAPLCDLVLSSGHSVLAVLDRALALPRGISLADGHAVARFAGARVTELAARWARLLAEVGGIANGERFAAPYLGSLGEDPVAHVSSSLERAFALSAEQELDVMLFACLP